MGCTSSRTKSVEDLSGGGVGTKSQAPKNQTKDANGQAAKNNSTVEAPIMRETTKQTNAAAPPSSSSSSNAIQIPGTHRSFLAPDGIPFIDEDVDDDGDGNSSAGVTSPRPDVNKNLAKELVNKPADAKLVTVEVKSSQPPQPTEEIKQSPTKVAELQVSSTVQEPQADVNKAWTDALDVLSKDLELDGGQSSVNNDEPIHISATVADTAAASAPEHSISEDQQAAAAVKIQAGIRGYRDRQKVKAIRAAKHVPTEDLESSTHQPEVSASVPVVNVDQVAVDVKQDEGESTAPAAATVVVEEIHLSSSELTEDSDDPDKQRAAAIKIQANYKGWKTRKEICKVKA